MTIKIELSFGGTSTALFNHFRSAAQSAAQSYCSKWRPAIVSWSRVSAPCGHTTVGWHRHLKNPKKHHKHRCIYVVIRCANIFKRVTYLFVFDAQTPIIAQLEATYGGVASFNTRVNKRVNENLSEWSFKIRLSSKLPQTRNILKKTPLTAVESWW